MIDHERLKAAMVALGYETTGSINQVGGTGATGFAMAFFREREGNAFSTYTTDIGKLQAVQRKYAEIGVREWAKRSGYGVALAENDGRKLTLVNRRG